MFYWPTNAISFLLFFVLSFFCFVGGVINSRGQTTLKKTKKRSKIVKDAGSGKEASETRERRVISLRI